MWCWHWLALCGDSERIAKCQPVQSRVLQVLAGPWPFPAEENKDAMMLLHISLSGLNLAHSSTAVCSHAKLIKYKRFVPAPAPPGEIYKFYLLMPGTNSHEVNALVKLSHVSLFSFWWLEERLTWVGVEVWVLFSDMASCHFPTQVMFVFPGHQSKNYSTLAIKIEVKIKVILYVWEQINSS